MNGSLKALMDIDSLQNLYEALCYYCALFVQCFISVYILSVSVSLLWNGFGIAVNKRGIPNLTFTEAFCFHHLYRNHHVSLYTRYSIGCLVICRSLQNLHSIGILYRIIWLPHNMQRESVFSMLSFLSDSPPDLHVNLNIYTVQTQECNSMEAVPSYCKLSSLYLNFLYLYTLLVTSYIIIL